MNTFVCEYIRSLNKSFVTKSEKEKNIFNLSKSIKQLEKKRQNKKSDYYFDWTTDTGTVCHPDEFFHDVINSHGG